MTLLTYHQLQLHNNPQLRTHYPRLDSFYVLNMIYQHRLYQRLYLKCNYLLITDDIVFATTAFSFQNRQYESLNVERSFHSGLLLFLEDFYDIFFCAQTYKNDIFFMFYSLYNSTHIHVHCFSTTILLNNFTHSPRMRMVWLNPQQRRPSFDHLRNIAQSMIHLAQTIV